MGDMNHSTCLIVEDQESTREFLSSIVSETFPEMRIKLASSVKEALDQIKSPGLGLVLVDLGLPDGDGLTIVSELKRINSPAHSVIVTVFDDDVSIFRALKSGANGYLLKDSDPVILIDILKRIERGEPPLSPAVARRVLQHFQVDTKTDITENHLTPRELETLHYLSKGLTVFETAEKMKISAQTVSSYVKIIYQKLHVSNRVELVQEATKRKLIF